MWRWHAHRGHQQAAVSPGKPWKLPGQPAGDRNLAVLGSPGAANGGAPGAAVVTAASATGKPVGIPALTTATATVTAEPCSASASVTTSWIGAINSGTGWPGPHSQVTVFRSR